METATRTVWGSAVSVFHIHNWRVNLNGTHGFIRPVSHSKLSSEFSLGTSYLEKLELAL